jgi:hypothetical protein
MKWILCCAALALASVPATALAGDCCAHCGCHSNCCKVCRLVCETKKVTKPEYGCECEDFCVPGPSKCTIECDECGHKTKVYTPCCASVHTRTKLTKKDVTKEVKSYKWVVEDLCGKCAQHCANADAPTPLAAAAEPSPAMNDNRLTDNQVSAAAALLPAGPAEEKPAGSLKAKLARTLAPLTGKK